MGGTISQCSRCVANINGCAERKPFWRPNHQAPPRWKRFCVLVLSGFRLSTGVTEFLLPAHDPGNPQDAGTSACCASRSRAVRTRSLAARSCTAGLTTCSKPCIASRGRLAADWRLTRTASLLERSERYPDAPASLTIPIRNPRIAGHYGAIAGRGRRRCWRYRYCDPLPGSDRRTADRPRVGAVLCAGGAARGTT